MADSSFESGARDLAHQFERTGDDVRRNVEMTGFRPGGWTGNHREPFLGSLLIPTTSGSSFDSSRGSDARTEWATLGRRTSLRHRTFLAAHGHRIPVSQYLTFGIWFLVLFSEYILVRFTCVLGIPEDCTDKSDVVTVMQDMQYLLFPGLVLAVLTGMHWPDRFDYVFTFKRDEPRGWYFLLTFWGFGVFWSSLHLIPSLGRFTLTEITPAFAIPLLLLLAGSVALVSWHLRTAWRHNSRSGFLAYLLSRLAVVIFYSMYIIIKLADSENVTFHFHHYAFGFLAASLAEFNHPVSMTLLACGTAVFVQGLSAYGADPIIGPHLYRMRVPSKVSGEPPLLSPAISQQAVNFFQQVCDLSTTWG